MTERNRRSSSVAICRNTVFHKMIPLTSDTTNYVTANLQRIQPFSVTEHEYALMCLGYYHQLLYRSIVVFKRFFIFYETLPNYFLLTRKALRLNKMQKRKCQKMPKF